MGAGTLISVEEYLATSYRPDCDYVDGVVEERHVGEFCHSRLQVKLLAYFCAREAVLNILTLPAQRVRVSSSKFRVPDVCLAMKRERIITTPPYLCIEILSPEDTTKRLQSRIDDYLALGVPCVWVIDPESMRGWVYDLDGAKEMRDGIMRTPDGRIAMPLSEVTPESE